MAHLKKAMKLTPVPCNSPTERHMVLAVDSWSSFTIPKGLNRQTVGGRGSGSLLGDDLPALALTLVDRVVISVYKAYVGSTGRAFRVPRQSATITVMLKAG